MVEKILKSLSERLAQVKSDLQANLSAVRTGRANPALVEGVEVEAYGGKMSLRDLAHISAPEPRMLVIQPWDGSLVEIVAKTLSSAGIGVTPAVDGGIIRLPLPQLTEERRLELAKLVGSKLEEARVQLRQARHDALSEFERAEKDSLLTEDDVKRGEAAAQREVDRVTAELEQLARAKEVEVKTI
jgi:ribosome recycling factor